MMSDSSYPIFPFFAFLGFVLALVPMPWHLQAWNAGTCLYMFWAALGCLNQAVNSVIWHGNALNSIPIWCDISSRIVIAESVAIPAASLCINRRLYKIATTQCVSITRGQKRRAIIEDLCIGLGLPLINVALAYIVTGHRFNIYEDIGCYPALYNVWLTYLLVASWPIVLGLISAVYCILSIRSFIRRSAQFNEMLASNSSLTINRYFRLMALATTELLCTTPFASFSIYLNLTAQPVHPYLGWADTHFNFSRVEQIPATLWHLSRGTVVSLELSRWLMVTCALVFFGFFGFAAEARRNYQAFFTSMAKKIRLSTSGRRSIGPKRRFMPSRSPKLATVPVSMANAGVLPVFVTRPPAVASRDSFLTTTSPSDEKGHYLTSPTSSTFTVAALSRKEQDPYNECYGHAY